MDHKAQAPLQDATGMTQTYQQRTAFDPTTGDPGRARRNRSADGSDAANPRTGAASDRVRRGTHDNETAHRVSEGTPRETPAVPTALAPVHGHARFPAPPGPLGFARPRPGNCKIRALDAGVQGRPAAAPTGPTPSETARPLPPSPSGRRTDGRPCPIGGGLFDKPS